MWAKLGPWGTEKGKKMVRKIALPAALLMLGLTASTASANTGPVGQWPLNEGGGNIASDSSGYGDNGAILGAASWTNGPDGAALNFAGGGTVRIPDAPQLEPSSTVSVAAWVARQGSPGTYKYILAKGGNGCIAASYGLYSGASGGLQFYVSRGHGTTYALSSDAGSGVWDGRWHLVVGTFDGTTIRLYVDGAEVGSGTVYPGPIEYSLSGANDLFVGAYPSCRNRDFDSTISEVRIWNRALSATDVYALTATNQPPPTGGSTLPSTVAPNNLTPAPNGSGGGAGTGTPAPSNRPVLSTVTLSVSTITIGPGSSGHPTPVIVYNDSDSSRVAFTILQVQSKQAQTRCVKAARQLHHSTMEYCPRLVALGRFVHQDHAGRNAVRFPRALTPAPGKYVLEVTPNLNGRVGNTVVIRFQVVAKRR
jgi:hypothetical protein